MSERWESSVQEWCEKSKTSNLEYLDLIETKPTTKQLAHNISVIHDRVCLSCRVHLKNFKQIQEEIAELRSENLRITEAVKNLTQEVVENRPLTLRQIHNFVSQTVEQPGIFAKQVLKISKETKEELKEVKSLIKRLEALVT